MSSGNKTLARCDAGRCGYHRHPAHRVTLTKVRVQGGRREAAAIARGRQGGGRFTAIPPALLALALGLPIL